MLRQGTTNLTTVPTAAMRGGDFSASGIPAIYDPLTTCGSLANGACKAGQPVSRAPFPGKIIPASRLNPSAAPLANMLWPLPNQPGVVNNFFTTYSRPYNYNQYTGRFDHRFSDKQSLFGRFTQSHKNYTPNAPLLNQTGTGNVYDTNQAVLGDTYSISSTLFADVRLSILRFNNRTLPMTCCNFDFSKIGPGWAKYQSEATFAMLPEPNVTGMYNFNTIPIILNTDNAYTSTGITEIPGRHSIRFGGEIRRIEWYYVQTNSAGGTFTFGSGFTSQLPLVSGSTPGSPKTPATDLRRGCSASRPTAAPRSQRFPPPFNIMPASTYTTRFA